ncbi:hypothetical protein AAF712_016802, partial [Marasmius tenuissimus]
MQDEWTKFDGLLSTERFTTCTVELVVPYSTSENELPWALEPFPQCSRDGRVFVTCALFKVAGGPIIVHQNPEAMEELDW